MENSQVTLTEEEITMLKDEDSPDSASKVIKHDLAAEDVSIGFNDAALDMINERFSRQTVLTGLTPYGFINIALYLPVSMVWGYLLVNKALKGIFERQVISVKQGALDHEQTPKI